MALDLLEARSSKYGTESIFIYMTFGVLLFWVTYTSKISINCHWELWFTGTLETNIQFIKINANFKRYNKSHEIFFNLTENVNYYIQIVDICFPEFLPEWIYIYFLIVFGSDDVSVRVTSAIFRSVDWYSISSYNLSWIRSAKARSQIKIPT